MKGQKFELQGGAGGSIKLWHNFDKSPAEQFISRRTSALVLKIKEHLVGQGRATPDTVQEFMIATGTSDTFGSCTGLPFQTARHQDRSEGHKTGH